MNCIFKFIENYHDSNFTILQFHMVGGFTQNNILLRANTTQATLRAHFKTWSFKVITLTLRYTINITPYTTFELRSLFFPYVRTGKINKNKGVSNRLQILKLLLLSSVCTLVLRIRFSSLYFYFYLSIHHTLKIP